MALLLVGSGNGLFPRSSRPAATNTAESPYSQARQSAGAKSAVPRCRSGPGRRKAVIMPAFHHKLARFEVKRPGRHSFQNFNRQIARYPGFGKHAVKIRVKTQDVLCWPPRAHDLQIVSREDLRLNGAFSAKPFRYRVPARKGHKTRLSQSSSLLVAHITVIINRFPDIGNFCAEKFRNWLGTDISGFFTCPPLAASSRPVYLPHSHKKYCQSDGLPSSFPDSRQLFALSTYLPGTRAICFSALRRLFC